MATLDQLKAALRNADAAGDTAAATQLAKSIKATQEPSVASDMLRSAGSGLRLGAEALAGLPGEVNNMTTSAAGRVARALFGDKATETAKSFVPAGLQSQGYTTADVQSATDPTLGPAYEPKTTPGRYTRAVTEQVPGLILGPGGKMLKGAQALAGGVGSEFAGEQAAGSRWEPLARFVGGLAGNLTPAGIERSIARPPAAQVARDANVSLLNKERVPLSAGNETGGKTTQYLESELGGGQYQDLLDRQRGGFTDATMRRLGEKAGPALPEDLARARARIGGDFDRLAASTTVPFDPTLENALVDIGARYEQVAPLQAPGVRQLFNSMIDKAHLNGGTLTGDQYKEMTTTLREMGASADPATAEALSGFRDSLDSAVERSLSGPELAEWQRARQQYANLMTVERAMTGSGVEAAGGAVSPARLRSAISGGGNGPAAIAEGRSNLTDLANAGVSVLKDVPGNSGSAGRVAARALPGAVAGLGYGLTTGDPLTGVMATLGGALAPQIAGRAVMSPVGQGLLRGVPGDQRALMAALLAQAAAGGRR